MSSCELYSLPVRFSVYTLSLYHQRYCFGATCYSCRCNFFQGSSFSNLSNLKKGKTITLWLHYGPPPPQTFSTTLETLKTYDMLQNSKHSWELFFLPCEVVSPSGQVRAHQLKCACQLYPGRTVQIVPSRKHCVLVPWNYKFQTCWGIFSTAMISWLMSSTSCYSLTLFVCFLFSFFFTLGGRLATPSLTYEQLGGSLDFSFPLSQRSPWCLAVLKDTTLHSISLLLLLSVVILLDWIGERLRWFCLFTRMPRSSWSLPLGYDVTRIQFSFQLFLSKCW